MEIPANGRIVMPGFVDASLSLNPCSGNPARKRMKANEFYEESLALMRSCLQHGTLAVDVKATAADEFLRADISVLRKLTAIGSNPVRMVRTWRVGRLPHAEDERLGDFEQTFDVLIRRKLIHFVELAGESGAPVEERILGVLQRAQIGIKLLWSGGPIEVLAQLLDRLHPRTVCCLSQPNAAEFTALAQAPGIAVLATGKDVFEGPALPFVRQFVDAGGAVALSSGYDSSSACSFSMPMSVALAVARLGLSTEEAFTAATINAAHAAGCARLTGSLELGKQADLLILNVSDYREVPRQFGINHVEMAIRQGSIVLNRSRWKAAAN